MSKRKNQNINTYTYGPTLLNYLCASITNNLSPDSKPMLPNKRI